jgi:hypothetical protein
MIIRSPMNGSRWTLLRTTRALRLGSHITWDGFWEYPENNSKKKMDVYDY